jgi:hypothetical protein
MSKHIINELAWPAVRYALGRQTYVVSQVSDAIRSADKQGLLTDATKQTIIRDIKAQEGQLGMDIDEAHWKGLLNSLQLSKESE